MRAFRIRDSEKTAFHVIRDGRCIPESWLCYSIDGQVDCVWLT